MTYTYTIKGKNLKQETVYILKSQASYDSFKVNKTGNIVSKADSKAYIRNYLDTNKKQLAHKIIHIAYITNQGMVNLNQNVTVGDKLTDDDVDKLLADPKENLHIASGEYNNQLAHKTIYGVSITSIDHKVAKAKAATTATTAAPRAAPAATRSKFKFNF